MHSDESSGVKFKRVCLDFPNPTIITNSTTLGKIQVNFGHAPIGNNSLGENVTVFYIAGSLESLMEASVNAKYYFASAKNYLCLPVT